MRTLPSQTRGRIHGWISASAASLSRLKLSNVLLSCGHAGTGRLGERDEASVSAEAFLEGSPCPCTAAGIIHLSPPSAGPGDPHKPRREICPAWRNAQPCTHECLHWQHNKLKVGHFEQSVCWGDARIGHQGALSNKPLIFSLVFMQIHANNLD